MVFPVCRSAGQLGMAAGCAGRGRGGGGGGWRCGGGCGRRQAGAVAARGGRAGVRACGRAGAGQPCAGAWAGAGRPATCIPRRRAHSAGDVAFHCGRCARRRAQHGAAIGGGGVAPRGVARSGRPRALSVRDPAAMHQAPPPPARVQQGVRVTALEELEGAAEDEVGAPALPAAPLGHGALVHVVEVDVACRRRDRRPSLLGKGLCAQDGGRSCCRACLRRLLGGAGAERARTLRGARRVIRAHPGRPAVMLRSRSRHRSCRPDKRGQHRKKLGENKFFWPLPPNEA